MPHKGSNAMKEKYFSRPPPRWDLHVQGNHQGTFQPRQGYLVAGAPSTEP